MREVIRALEERGVVAVKHGRGATVTMPERWNVLDRDVVFALLRGPSRRAVLAELLEARTVLEVETAGLAAERANDAHIGVLRAAFARLEAAPRRAAEPRGAAEIAFHRAVMEAAGNRPIAILLAPVLDALETAAPTLGRRAEARPSIAGSSRRSRRAMRSPPKPAMREHLDSLAGSVGRARST